MRKRLFYESKNVLNSNEGYVLINVVLIFLVVLIVIASLSATSVHNHKQALKQRNHSAAYYYAEGGLNEFCDKYFENDEVERILGHLDDSSAELIRMRFIMDLPYDVIASKLRIKETAARKRVNRAKNKLQQIYEEIKHDKT